ncbi:unnamed protein product [Phaeothamnion confervicola]
MAEQQRARRVVEGAEDAGAYSSLAFQLCEDALEKLKALDYENELCKARNLERFTRTFFAMPGSNPGSQFRSFQETCSWLMQIATGDPGAYKLDKYDDPNTSINKLVLALKALAFSGDFPVSRLKQAYGDAACTVLDFLADKALAARGFSWQQPVHTPEELQDEAVAPDDADLDEIVDDAEVAVGEEEPEPALAAVQPAKEAEVYNMSDSNIAILETRIDPVQWKQEIERVGPKLRLAQPTTGKEWRAHVTETAQHEASIKAALPEADGHLTAIAGEVADALERVRTKERYANSQYQALQAEYHEARDARLEVQAKVTATGGKVGELAEELGRLTEELEEVKDHMTERGAQMSESSPLVSLKQSLQHIKGEIKTFDLRIGIVSHSLTALKVKRRMDSAGTRRNKGDPGGPNDYLETSDAEGLE